MRSTQALLPLACRLLTPRAVRRSGAPPRGGSAGPSGASPSEAPRAAAIAASAAAPARRDALKSLDWDSALKRPPSVPPTPEGSRRQQQPPPAQQHQQQEGPLTRRWDDDSSFWNDLEEAVGAADTAAKHASAAAPAQLPVQSPAHAPQEGRPPRPPSQAPGNPLRAVEPRAAPGIAAQPPPRDHPKATLEESVAALYVAAKGKLLDEQKERELFQQFLDWREGRTSQPPPAPAPTPAHVPQQQRAQQPSQPSQAVGRPSGKVAPGAGPPTAPRQLPGSVQQPAAVSAAGTPRSVGSAASAASREMRKPPLPPAPRRPVSPKYTDLHRPSGSARGLPPLLESPTAGELSGLDSPAASVDEVPVPASKPPHPALVPASARSLYSQVSVRELTEPRRKCVVRCVGCRLAVCIVV